VIELDSHRESPKQTTLLVSNLADLNVATDFPRTGARPRKAAS